MIKFYIANVMIGVWFSLDAPSNAAEANLVKAKVWKTLDVGSIPTGGTKF
jgi:hypothetical protein